MALFLAFLLSNIKMLWMNFQIGCITDNLTWLHPNVNIYALLVYHIIPAHFMWILIILLLSLLLKI